MRVDDAGREGPAGWAVVELVGMVCAARRTDPVSAVEAGVVQVGEPGDQPGARLRAPGVDSPPGRERFRHLLAVREVGRGDADVRVVVAQLALVGALRAGVVPGSDADHSGADDDLPPRPLADDGACAGPVDDRRQQVRRRLNQVRRRKARPPQFTAVRGRVLVEGPAGQGRRSVSAPPAEGMSTVPICAPVTRPLATSWCAPYFRAVADDQRPPADDLRQSQF